MKLTGFLCFLVISITALLSCKQEYSLENASTGSSTGTLKTVAGDCMPSGSSGIFQQGVTVDSSNFIYVDINVFTAGSYLVFSDTVNRVSFKGAGFFETRGIHTVQLAASGTPFTNGTVPYSVKYRGQKCIVNVFTIK